MSVRFLSLSMSWMVVAFSEMGKNGSGTGFTERSRETS